MPPKKTFVHKNEHKQKIRVLHVIPAFTQGGAEEMLLKIIQASHDGNIQHAVISLSSAGNIRERFEAISQTSCLNMQPGTLNPSALLKAISVSRRYRPDVIQGWMYHGNIAALWMKLFQGKETRLFWSIRQSLYDIDREKGLSKAIIRLNAFLAKIPEKIIFNSYCARRQHADFGFENPKMMVIPNGFDLHRFKPNIHMRQKFRDSFNLPNDTIIIGMLARFHPIKNHLGFLEAAKILHARHPNIHFAIAGTDVTTQNLKDHLDFRLKICVHLFDEIRDTQVYLNALDILTVPSLGEAFPNVIGEAMACGVPVVATDVGDSAEILGETGIIVKTNSPMDIAIGWEKIISMTQQGRQKLCSLALDRVARNYDIHDIAERYNLEYSCRHTKELSANQNQNQNQSCSDIDSKR